MNTSHDDQNASRATLLVIDDDPTIRLAAEDLLTGEGFCVLCIETPQDLPALLTRCQPDAFLVDVNLPFMSGYRVCTYIRAEAGLTHVPILMMTSNDDVDSVNQAYEAGATDFLSKPINYLLLAHRVKYMLRGYYTLRHFQQQQTSLIQAQRIAQLGYWSLDIQQNSIDIEPYSASLLGWAPLSNDAHNVPRVYSDLLTHVDPYDLSIVTDAFSQLLESKTSFSIQHRVRLAGGEERILNHQGGLFESDGGRYIRAIGTIQDITEQKKAEQKIYEMAFYDALTLLPNRAFLREFWDRRYANITQPLSFAVICLSLNHFSRVNDSFGQDIGDELMRRVANRLNRSAQSKSLQGQFQIFEDDELLEARHKAKVDVVARVDSNSFVLFSKPNTSEQFLISLCDEIQSIIAEPFTIHGTSIFLTSNIGVACLSDEISNLSLVIDAALSAVNVAKKIEHNQCVFFSAEMMTRARDRIELERDLRTSLKNEDFFIVYQPKLCLKTLEITGLEALVRWQHPVKGLIAPNHFISIAEETGIIEELGLFVIKKSCQDLKKLEEKGFKRISMALNISARQFSQGRFTDLVSDAIHECGIEPKKIELEITESIIMTDVQHALQMLHTLKDIGVRIALDDFGTGYSSFSYLAKFPFDTLKIDQEFLREVPENHNSTAIIIAIVSLARGLNMNTVAEGIETLDQLKAVTQMGGDQGQGYLISAPVVFDDILEMLIHKTWAHFLDQNGSLLQAAQ